jgi:cell fate regulator YaaT (PSP1 superfamily)
MGCGTCGTGKPGGCKSNGSCGTGSCNRMNVYDWLKNLPFADSDGGCKVIEVSFNQGSRKDFYRNVTLQEFDKGELVTLEGVSGFDVGEVSLTGELVRLQMKKKGVNEMNPDMKKVLRRSTERDIELYSQQKSREPEALMRSRAISRQLNLDMKLSEVEFQADGRKATFFYTADDRVDFRELIKIYASEFKVKVEMRQIGIRQDAGKVGGIGSCGRELCCSTWLTDFKSVTTTAARYQNLSINQTKLSGQCGRLKCCLNYELDTYLDALQGFPNNADTLQTTKGNASLVKKDIFKNLMWYMLPDSSMQYPLTITRVKEIVRLNAKGERPDDLQPVDLTSNKQREEVPAHVELVGQISLNTLERNSKKRKDKEKDKEREVKSAEKKNEAPQRRTEQPQQSKGQQQKAEKKPQQQQHKPESKQPQPKQKPLNNNNNQQQPPKNKPPQPKRANVNGNNPQQKPPPQQKQQSPQRPQLPPAAEGENI